MTNKLLAAIATIVTLLIISGVIFAFTLIPNSALPYIILPCLGIVLIIAIYQVFLSIFK